MRKLLTILATAATLTLSGCGYNTMQAQDENVKGKWAEVLNQYQRPKTHHCLGAQGPD